MGEKKCWSMVNNDDLNTKKKRGGKRSESYGWLGKKNGITWLVSIAQYTNPQKAKERTYKRTKIKTNAEKRREKLFF